jgi:phage tail sheath gpL-like
MADAVVAAEAEAEVVAEAVAAAVEAAHPIPITNSQARFGIQ